VISADVTPEQSWRIFNEIRVLSNLLKIPDFIQVSVEFLQLGRDGNGPAEIWQTWSSKVSPLFSYIKCRGTADV